MCIRDSFLHIWWSGAHCNHSYCEDNKGGWCNCCKGTTRSTSADLRLQRVDALYPLFEVSTKLQATTQRCRRSCSHRRFGYRDLVWCRFDSLSSELEDCSRRLTRGGVNYPAKLCFQAALMTAGKQWPGKPSMTAARTDEAIPSGGATESREKSHPWINIVS